MLDNQISEHFTLSEMTRTNTGLANVPGEAEMANLKRLCDVVLEPMRELLGPLNINSGFRSPEVNHAVYGAKSSQHMSGLAADLVPAGHDLAFAFHWVRSANIPFDQLIIEPTWLHVSVARDGVPPRRQCLRAHKTKQGMVYEPA